MPPRSRSRRAPRARAQAPAPETAPAFWPWALAVAALAFAIRCLHVWLIRPAPFFALLMGDAASYEAWARQVAAGDWLGRDVFYQAPLYPYVLGVVYGAAGRDFTTVRLLQAIAGAAACGLVAGATARLF